jgi:hypothetical protein
MGKGGDQKRKESLELNVLQQEADANRWMGEFAKEMRDISKKRYAEQEEYLKGQVDPLLKGYSQTGFAPGERKLLRARSEEDVARIHGQGEKQTLTALGQMGFRSSAPSGGLARAKLALGQGRAEARVKGLRDIETQGFETRRNVLPAMFQRAGAYDPQGTSNTALAFGRPTSAAMGKTEIKKGFWGNFGGKIAGAGLSMIPGV